MYFYFNFTHLKILVDLLHQKTTNNCNNTLCTLYGTETMHLVHAALITYVNTAWLVVMVVNGSERKRTAL